MSTPIQNILEEGLDLDTLDTRKKNTTYSLALNMINQTRDNLFVGLSNEEATKELYKYEGTIVGNSYVESIDSTIIFLKGGGGNEIHLFNHETRESKFVASDSEFGCNWNFQNCEWIRPTMKTMQPCNELNVYWSSGCEYYVVNIDEMLNEKRKAGLKAAISSENNRCGMTCEYFKLMKCVCAPKTTAISSDYGGHNVEAGAYQFAALLEDNQGNDTNWFWISQPTFIGGETNQSGERTQGSIEVTMTNLDCRFDRVKVAVIKTIGGVTTTELILTREYSSDSLSFRYRGEQGTPIDLSEILVKRKTYIKGRELIQKDNRLWLYGIKQETNLNMQRKVQEQADLKFIEIKKTAKDVDKYSLMTLMRGENYMFGVVYHYCDGTNSPVFLLTPKGGGGGGGRSYEANKPSGTAKGINRQRGGATNLDISSGDTSPTGGNAGLSGSSSGSTPSTSDYITENLNNWDTGVSNLVEAAKCDDCQPPHCCDEDGNIIFAEGDFCQGCDEDENQLAADAPKLDTMFNNHMDELSEFTLDKREQDVNYGKGSTIKESATQLADAAKNAEWVRHTKEDFKIDITASGSASGTETGMFNDHYHEKGKFIGESKTEVVSVISPQIAYSTELYPDNVDCDGIPLYGGLANTPVQLFRTPSADVSEIVIPKSAGVPSKQTPNVDPIYDNDILLLGIQIENVPIPTEEDGLSKPLCPNTPYSVVMVERTQSNSTVQAKGTIFGTFLGQSNGKTFVYPKHGVNSRSYLDRFINNDGSRFGSAGGSGVVFHGLDTNIGKVGLSGESLRLERIVSGIGHRYGLYAKGREPLEPLTGRRVDQRGARQAISLNFSQGAGGSAPISFRTYVDADSVVDIDGSRAISAKLRESFVYLEAGGAGNNIEDDSFYPDTLDHEAPIVTARAYYGAIVREIENQYGSVIAMKFIDTGIKGIGGGSNGVYPAVQGIAGDSFIGPYTIKRTAYVSDKVGNKFPTPDRERTVCESADDVIITELGIDNYPTKLPKSGDRKDARNWAGGYEDDNWNAVIGSQPRRDFYYPKVVKTLVVTWGESRINPWKRAIDTRDPDQNRITGGVYFPKLGGLYLDSNSSEQHPWEDSYLNRFYYELEQPSKAQLIRKALVRHLVTLIMPMLGGFGLFVNGEVPEIVGALLISPAAIAMWRLMQKVTTREDYINRMLGIPECATDDSGGETDHNIVNFEDNYHSYSYDFNKSNYEQAYYSMPLIYNTCICNDCINKETTNEVFFSNKQIEGSQLDSYRRFKSLNYLEIPADSGMLKNMFVMNNQLYAHTTDFLMRISQGPSGSQNSLGYALLGGNELMTEPQAVMEGVVEGFAGIQDPKAARVTKYGYFFIDEIADKVYNFRGDSPVEITDSVSKFMKNHIAFCNPTSCRDEKVMGTSFYSIGYDPRYERVLLTKHDKESWTISFDPRIAGRRGGWISFHSYTPQDYLWDRAEMYSIHDNAIHLHNVKGEYNKFYGQTYPSMVEVVINAKGEYFEYIDTDIRIETDNADIKSLDLFFDYVAMWNDSQGTGWLRVDLEGDNKSDDGRPLWGIKESCGTLKVTKRRRRYQFNQIKDRVLPSCSELPMTIKEDCKPYAEINEGIFSDKLPRQNYVGQVVTGDHLYQRYLYLGGDNKTRIKILQINNNIKLAKI